MERQRDGGRPDPFERLGVPEWPELRLMQSSDLAVSPSVGAGDAQVQYPEDRRMRAGLYVAYNLHYDTGENFRQLTAAQTVRPLRQSGGYRELHELSRKLLPDEATYRVCQFVDVIHDVGRLAEVQTALGMSDEDNHDAVLARLLSPGYETARDYYLPSLQHFSEADRQTIVNVLTSRFNLARFAESQQSPDEMAALDSMAPRELAVAIMHGIHDIGGALGHQAPTSSLTLDERTAHRLLDAAHALLNPPEEFGLKPDTPLDSQVRYAGYLTLRAHRVGLNLPPLDSRPQDMIEQAETVALLSVANFLWVDTPEDFAPALAAFRRLPYVTRALWSLAQAAPFVFPANMPYTLRPFGTDYVPAFIRALDSQEPQAREEALYRVLGYVAQAFLQAMSFHLMNATPQEPSLDAPSPYTSLNLYHLARWCADPRNGGYQDITIVYRRSGETLTPIPIDPATYLGKEKQYRLRHPAKEQYPQSLPTELRGYRHVESDKNKLPPNIVVGRNDDAPPTERGSEQAVLLGRYLGHYRRRAAAAYTAPAERAIQTAEIALRTAGLNIPLVIVEELAEIDAGWWEGRSSRYGRLHLSSGEVERSVHPVYRGLDDRPYGGESVREVGERIAHALRVIAQRHGGEEVLIFWHDFGARCLETVQAPDPEAAAGRTLTSSLAYGSESLIIGSADRLSIFYMGALVAPGIITAEEEARSRRFPDTFVRLPPRTTSVV